MKTAFALVFLIIPLQLAVTAAPSLKLVAEVKGFASPESIAWDGTHYYVSNVGKELKPTEKDGVQFLNDVCAAGADKLLVSATDKNLVYLIDLKEKSAKPIKFDHAPNGLIFTNAEEETYLGIAEWGGKLFYYDSREAEPSQALADLTIPNGPVAGPADFFYDSKTAALVLPCMMEGRVLVMKLENHQ
jgi:hypothetical protein